MRSGLIGGIIIAALVVLFVLSMSGCSAFRLDQNVRADCEFKCDECKGVTLTCDHDLVKNQEGVEDQALNINKTINLGR